MRDDVGNSLHRLCSASIFLLEGFRSSNAAGKRMLRVFSSCRPASMEAERREVVERTLRVVLEQFRGRKGLELIQLMRTALCAYIGRFKPRGGRPWEKSKGSAAQLRDLRLNIDRVISIETIE